MEDEITKDVSIVISDFADEDELEENKLLWENQISDLNMYQVLLKINYKEYICPGF